MADNVELSPGSGGDTIATDDDGTAQHQYVKVEFGPDNTQTKVTSSAGLPVKVIEGVTPGTGATDLGKAEDAAHSSSDVGVMPLAVRNDVLAALAGTDGDYAPLQVDSDGALFISTKSTEDSNNTTAATLGISAVFTGTGVETLNYKTITILCFADQDSAADGLSLEWSGDNTNWNHIATYTYSASTDLSIGASVRGRYFRIVYTNGSTGQGAFRLFTFLHPMDTSHSIRPLEFTLTGQESAEMVRSILAAKQSNGAYANIGATNNANLKISLQEASDGMDIGAGNAGSETLRVSVSTDDVNLSAIKTAVEIMDDWDESDRAKVNVIAGQAGIAGGTGADGATVPRVTLATDVPLPAGTNGIGKLTANSGVDIGDVDVTSVPAPLSTTGGGTEAAALRVTIANDSTGVVSVDDNGGALTVDNGGTFAVQSTLQTGSNAIGKLAANSGVDIGDVDVLSLPGSIQGPASPTIDSYTHAAINLTTGADQVLASSAANKQIWVYGYFFTCGDADGQSVSFQDEDNAALSGIMEFAQYGGGSVPPSGNFSMPIWKLGTDKDLECDITNGDVDGWIAYAVVSV